MTAIEQSPDQKPEPCRWCGEAHGVLCPWVKAFEFGPDGTLKRVEFVTYADIANEKPNVTVPPEVVPYRTIKPGWKRP